MPWTAVAAALAALEHRTPLPARSPELSVMIVNNKQGSNISVRRDFNPWFNLGPYDHEIDLPEAMQLAAVHIRMNNLLKGADDE